MQHATGTHPAAASRGLRVTEALLARGALLTLGALAPIVVGAAALLAGPGGALGAAAGLGLIGILFGFAGALQAAMARRSPSTMVAVVAGGVGLRLVLYFAALSALARVEALHRPSLAIATVVGFVVTLVYEMRLASRLPHAFWVQPASSGHVGRS